MLKPKNPLNDNDVDGNSIAWMKDQEEENSCGCESCECKDE